MDEKDLLFLKTLYEEKNLTQASKKLYVSQPALTGRLHQLESDFDCKIVLRKPRGIEFSSEGELLVRFAEKTLRALQETREQIRSIRGSANGTLRIGCSNLYAKYELPAQLASFRRQFPAVEIHLKTGFSQEIYQQLLHGSIHLGIIRGDYNWPGKRQLLEEDSYYVFSASPISLSELPSLPRIHYDTDAPLQLALDNWWFSNYKRPPAAVMEVDNVDTCVQLVREGLGFALLSGICARNIPDLYREKLTYKDGSSLQRRTWLYYDESALQIGTVKAFIDFLT